MAQPLKWISIINHDKPIHGGCTIYFPGGVQDSPQLRPGTVPRPGPSMRVTPIDPSAVAVAAIDEKAD